MLPATGILFSERLYLRIRLDLVKSESYQYPYFRAEDGEIRLTLLDGRSNGCVVTMNGITKNVVTATNSPIQIQFNKLNSGKYPLSIKDFSRSLKFDFVVDIQLNTDPSSDVISYINYNGTNYTTTDIITISVE